MNAKKRLTALARSLDRELCENILPYWYQTMDRRGGGFFGTVANDGTIDAASPKGLVMHSRHLWASSRAWQERRNPLDLAAARHAYAFLAGALHDSVGGGFWWTVDASGQPEHRNKVLYGQGFAVYGLSQYYRASGDQAALDLAVETFDLLEKTGRDHTLGGYFEAVDTNWTQPLVQALSDVDIPCAKSMNTNLHILEAYTSLFLATGLPRVRDALAALLEVFETRILVTPEHLGLYFDRDWTVLTDHVSYGHDVEASWLMTEAAEVLHGHPLPAAKSALYARVARTSLAVIQDNGGSLPNERHGGRVDTDRIWWVQAEALVGMINGWELTGEPAFLEAAESVWSFIEKYIVDRQHGEWYWQVSAAGVPAEDRPKGGLWKTSYHNGRACMEIIQRSRRGRAVLDSHG
jgi:mannobiose 2-epimerase